MIKAETNGIQNKSKSKAKQTNRRRKKVKSMKQKTCSFERITKLQAD